MKKTKVKTKSALKMLLKLTAAVLSVVMMLCALPLGAVASEVEVPSTPAKDGVTIQDVAAGAASVYDLYGEDYVLHIPDAAETYDPSYDDRVRSEEGDNLNVIVIDNGDGTNTMTVYDYPVKFVNEKGEIEDISLELTAAGGGAYKSKKSNIKTVFPQKAKDGIKLSHGEVNIKLTPKLDTQLTNTLLYSLADQSKGAKPKKVTVEPDASSVNVTKLDKKRLSYYYNNSTRIEYSLTYTGFKEDIVVSEYTGQTEYVFTLETNGLTLCESNGSYYLTDKKGETKAHLGDIIITTADGANNTMGYMTHKEIKKNKEYELTIHVDAEWLADEKTAYPIRIDPAVGIRDEVPAVQDVTINSLAGSNADENQLYVGYREGYGVSRVLMKFPGLILADVLDSKKIISANVRLYNNSPSHAPIKAIAYMFTGNEWEEETVTWTNVNANSYTHFLSQNRINTTHMWYTFDILDYIKYCIDSPTTVGQGILFRAEDSVEAAGVTNYNRFASFNHLDPNKRPVITVEYDNSNSDNARPFGWFDTVTDTYASGWAWCVDAPDEACTVYVMFKNTTTGQEFDPIVCRASRSRPDVAQAGYGTGNYGFRCNINWSKFTPGEYTVTAKAVSPGGSISDPSDCYELLSAKSYTKLTYDSVLPESAFYVNNKKFGSYLLNGFGLNRSSLLGDLAEESLAQWMFEEFDGGYVIRNMYEDEKYLSVDAEYSSSNVQLREFSANQRYRYVWDIMLAENGGCYVRSRYNGMYLYVDDVNRYVKVDASVGTVGTALNNSRVWRIVETTEYGNSDSYPFRELTEEAFFDGLYVMVGQSASIPYSTVIPNTMWAEPSDFVYEPYLINGHGEEMSTTAISVNETTGRVTCYSAGPGNEIKIKITHKVTGLKFDDIKVHFLSGELPLIDKELNVWNAVSHQVGYWSKSVINVYVHAFNKPDDYENKGIDYDILKMHFLNAVTHATDKWEEKLAKEDSTSYISFNPVSNIEEADIQWFFGADSQLCNNDNIILTEDEIQGTLGGSKPIASEYIGYLSYGNDRKIVVKRNKILLYTRVDELYTQWGKHNYTLEQFASWQKVVTTHELGHALGYSGHTGDVNTLMYPLSAPSSSCVPNDKEVTYMKHIYGLMRDAQDQ